MAITIVIQFNRTDTGLVIGGLTWDFCKTISTGANVSTIGCSLVELGVGMYLLTNPNITEDTVFSLYITATGTSLPGTFLLAGPTATDVVLIKKIIKNKLDFDKGTNNMVLYDDDGTTVLLTFPMTDNASHAIRGAGI